MSRRRSYYDVLGVARSATTDELRRAHRALARRYHPDAIAPGDPVGAAESARRIREINEAWQALRDPRRRADYDRTLAPEPSRPHEGAAYSPFPPGTEPEPSGGFDEWFADADRRRSAAKVVTRSARPPKPFPVRVLFIFGFIVLAGILLIVFVTGPSDDGPGAGVPAGACVRVNADGPPTQMPCGTPNDGRIVGTVDVPGACPNGSTGRRLAPGDTHVTCLEP